MIDNLPSCTGYEVLLPSIIAEIVITPLTVSYTSTNSGMHLERDLGQTDTCSITLKKISNPIHILNKKTTRFSCTKNIQKYCSYFWQFYSNTLVFHIYESNLKFNWLYYTRIYLMNKNHVCLKRTPIIKEILRISKTQP